MGDIDVENIADLVQPDQLGVLEDVGLSRVEDTQAGGDGAVADAAVVGDIAVLTSLQTAQLRYSRLLSPWTGIQPLH